jgi:hypothetical protein
MKPGDLVKNLYDWDVPVYEKIHGIMAFSWNTIDLGMILNWEYSTTDIPYVQVLFSNGIVGWVRYDKVRILHK